MNEEEAGEEELGCGERGCGGCEWGVDECVEEGDGGDDFHEDPGADTVDSEDGVGRGGESTKGGIEEELDGAHDGRDDKGKLSDD